MHVPKQAMPVQRVLNSTSKSIGNSGVDPSLTRQDIMDFLDGVQLGQQIVNDVLLKPIPNILKSLGPLFSGSLFGP
ncbi:MAG: hypothetical protein HC786_19025 [Richelia sp. CSU_2_1]|nr:hypothetical protein [Microcoleus sp. SU_5_3]NJR24098.1 hypothetical protein [Richelia sp. CSU_2_1]